jgi:hypothetical protein
MCLVTKTLQKWPGRLWEKDLCAREFHIVMQSELETIKRSKWQHRIFVHVFIFIPLKPP